MTPTALWILQGILAFVFMGAGGMKLMKGHEGLKADPKMAWANDFSAGFVQFIAIAEVAGALGMVLPGLTGIAPVLTPVAGIGLIVITAGAGVTHIRRNEPAMAFPPLFLGLLATAVVYGRLFVAPL